MHFGRFAQKNVKKAKSVILHNTPCDLLVFPFSKENFLLDKCPRSDDKKRAPKTDTKTRVFG